MARDISELGADVIDDTPVDPRHKLSAKKRNYIIGLSIGGVLLAGAVVASVILCNTALTDYSNVENVNYYFTPATMVGEGEEPTAVLYRLQSDKKYPETFRIPSQIKGYKVVGVAANAFTGHKEIKKVIMPNTIQFVGEEAFSKCDNLASFTWSKNLTDVGNNAFIETAFYNNLLKDTKNLYFLPSGVLVYVGQDYFQNGTALVSSTLSEAQINTIKTTYGASSIVKFEELGVIDICSGAFKNNKKIVYIDIPESFTDISDSTFEGCSSLKGFDASASKLATIGKSSFADCTSLVDVKLPAEMNRIGDYAFKNSGLTNAIPDISGVKELGSYIFAESKELESFTFTGTSIPEYAFSSCSKLDTITFTNKNALTFIGDGAFEATAFTEFEIPMNIKEINDAVFMNCAELKKVKMYGNPTGIEVEPDESEEEELEEDEEGEEEEEIIVYKGVNIIKSSAFQNCTSLDTISLYDDNYDVMVDEEGTFNLPKSLIRTDRYNVSKHNNNNVFASTAVKKVFIPKSVRLLGSYTFFDCDKLEEVTFEADSSLKNIKARAFMECVNLKSIDIPNSVESIGASVFAGCTEITSINFKDSKVTSISANLFQGCSKLASITLPEETTVIKNYAFQMNHALDYVIIPKEVIEVQEDSFTLMRPALENEDGEVIALEPGYEAMPIYIDMTYAETQSLDRNFSDDLADITCRVYYRKGTDAENPPSGKQFYWNGDKNNPAPIE